MSTAFDSAELITNAVGEMGPYQIMLLILVFLSRIGMPWQQLLILLHAPPVGNFTCSDPKLSQCDKNCTKHEFDRSVWERTIVQEWDLVCDRHIFSSMIQSIVMSGFLCGNIIFGYIADRYGRVTPVMIAITLQLITSVATAFSPWLWLYILLRWICCATTGGIIVSLFCVFIEFTSYKYRTRLAVLTSMPAQISFAMLGLIGYYCRRWDHIQLIISMSSLFMMSYCWLLPESPRWLLNAGKVENVVKILETGAKYNKRPVDDIRPNVEKFFSNNTYVEKSKRGNIIELFRTKRMRRKTIILIVNWLVVATEFFAIAQYSGQISGNMFLNIAFAGLSQIPGNILGIYLVEKIGRKLCLITAYFIALLPMLATSILPEEPYWVITTLGCISMSGIALSFTIVFLYTSELLPTMLRSVGLGLTSTCGRIGSMLSPFILELRYFQPWIPTLVLGILPVFAAVMTFCFLPETKGTMLPNTIEEADEV